MALTPQRKEELRKKYGITAPSSTSNTAAKKETAEERIKRLKGEPVEKRDGILKTIAKDLASPFLKVGVAGINAVESVADLARGDVAGASEALRKVRNVPFFGETTPFATGDETAGEAARKAIGTGAQIASTVVGGGAAKNIATQGLGTLVKQGVKTGAKIGAATGAGYEGGKALQDEQRTALQKLQDTLVGAVGGGIFGGLLGGIAPIVSKTTGAVKSAAGKANEAIGSINQKVRNSILKDPPTPPPGGASGRTARNVPSFIEGELVEDGIQQGVGTVRSVGQAAKETALSVIDKAKGIPERSKINALAKREAREAFQKLDPESQGAIRKGLIPRDVELIKDANKPTTEIFGRMVKAADDFETKRPGNTPPSIIIGEEYRKRLNGLSSVLDDAIDQQVKVVNTLQDVKIDPQTTVQSVLKKLGETPGLEGLNVDDIGKLDFSNTNLLGSTGERARKEIQQVFDDMVKVANDPKKLHLLRQRLFEDIGGKSKAGINVSQTEKSAVNAMRQGMSDAIDTIDPKYGSENTRIATFLNFKKEIERVFGKIKSGNEDIFDLKNSILLRRLTSNASTGQDMAEIIRNLEKALVDQGYTFDTNITELQEFVNLLDRYFDIAPDTSLLGITRTDLPKAKSGVWSALVDMVGENFTASDATAKQAIKELLEGKKSFSTGSIPKIEKGVKESIEQELDTLLAKAPEAKKEIDDTIRQLAQNIPGSTLVAAPVKGRVRALEKVLYEYDGDISKLTDTARNTWLVPNTEDIQTAIELIGKDTRVQRVKNVVPGDDPMGYSGVNIKIKSGNGVVSEIQINTPEIIYAKEIEKNAKSIIGEKLFNEIKEKTGVEAGWGHKLYEQYRDPKTPKADRIRIREESNQYYDTVRNKWRA